MVRFWFGVLVRSNSSDSGSGSAEPEKRQFGRSLELSKFRLGLGRSYELTLEFIVIFM